MFYTFENINTGEEMVIEMKLADLDEFKKLNPHLRQLITLTPLADPISLGITKPPQDFQKEVLGQIKRNNYGSTIGSGRWDV